jgi:hypothetical protein
MDTGVNNIGIGWGAGTGDTRGCDNIYIGSYNSPDITGSTYGNSIAIGNGVQISGSNQIVIGDNTQKTMISGTAYMKGIIQDDISNNTFIGNCFANRVGTNCVAIGNGALFSMTSTSAHNTAVGFNSGRNSTSTLYNTSVGTHSLYSNTTGYNNTAIGNQCLPTLITGWENTALGSYAGYKSTGIDNTIIGQASGYNTTTGSYNTFLGHGSGFTNTTGSYNTCLGETADISGVYSYSTAVGYGAKITASNTIVLGRSSEKTVISGNVSIGKTTNSYALDVSGSISAVSFNATSDYRIKDNVVDISNYSIDNLKPRMYFNRMSNKNEYGFIADELQMEYPLLVNGTRDDVFENGEPNLQTVNYIGLIPLLVREIQELKKKINL